MLDIILNILSSGLPCALLALGIFITFRLLDFADLTAEGSFLVGAAISAVMIVNGINPWIATLCSIVGGALCGFVTGALNRWLKIPKLLSGIITMTACISIAMLIMGFKTGNPTAFLDAIHISISHKGDEQTIYSMFWPWKEISPGKFMTLKTWPKVINVSIMAVIVTLVTLIIYYFFGTEYGMAIRATGMNEKMARAQGINTDIATIIGVAISNALISLGGSLYVQDSNDIGMTTATGFLVVGLASIVIGEAVFGKKTFKNWLISVILGAILYYVIITIALKLGLPDGLKKLLYAVLIVIALISPIIKENIKKLINKNKKVEVK